MEILCHLFLVVLAMKRSIHNDAGTEYTARSRNFRSSATNWTSLAIRAFNSQYNTLCMNINLVKYKLWNALQEFTAKRTKNSFKDYCKKLRCKILGHLRQSGDWLRFVFVRRRSSSVKIWTFLLWTSKISYSKPV